MFVRPPLEALAVRLASPMTMSYELKTSPHKVLTRVKITDRISPRKAPDCLAYSPQTRRALCAWAHRYVTMRKQSTRDIRRSNQLSVLKSIYATGSISRQQIAEKTGLSTATVANVVTDLLNYDIVIESGYEESQGGRP